MIGVYSMTEPESVRLKLVRADNHLYALTNDISAYLDRKISKFVLNVQPSNQRIVLVEYHVVEEPDRRLGLIIGDCVHNMRSALDHLTCRLVEKADGTVTNRTQFPIMDKRPKDKLGQPLKPSISGGVVDDVLTIIDALQPYQRGKDASLHPLAILRDLSNADKHHLLHATAARSAGNTCILRNSQGAVVAASVAPMVEHEAALGVFEFPEPYTAERYGDMEVEAQGSEFVAIKEPGPWAGKPVLIVLEQIRQFIGQIAVASLHPFLD
jgi:hypothetical protein